MRRFFTYLSILVCSSALFSCGKDTNSTDNITSVSRIGNQKAELGEGALWDHINQRLLWIDIIGKKVHTYEPKTGNQSSFNVPLMIGTVVHTQYKDSLLMALEDGIYTLSIETGQVDEFLPLERDVAINRFNDGKVDPQGRFWVGSMNLNEDQASGKLYRISNDKTVETMLEGVRISNGIVWSEQTNLMYYIDTPTRKLRIFDYVNTTGPLSDVSSIKDFTEQEGFPDGMTIDSDGHLWVGMWSGSQVLKIHHETGEVLKRIPVPAKNVTSCAFGGPDLDTLYITTASIGMNEGDEKLYPNAGGLFKIVPGETGRISQAFKLMEQ